MPHPAAQLEKLTELLTDISVSFYANDDLNRYIESVEQISNGCKCEICQRIDDIIGHINGVQEIVELAKSAVKTASNTNERVW